MSRNFFNNANINGSLRSMMKTVRYLIEGPAYPPEDYVSPIAVSPQVLSVTSTKEPVEPVGSTDASTPAERDLYRRFIRGLLLEELYTSNEVGYLDDCKFIRKCINWLDEK